MKGVLGHISALQGYTRLGTTWANEMNCGMNNVPGAGLIPQPVELQFSYHCLKRIIIMQVNCV